MSEITDSEVLVCPYCQKVQKEQNETLELEGSHVCDGCDESFTFVVEIIYNTYTQ